MITRPRLRLSAPPAPGSAALLSRRRSSGLGAYPEELKDIKYGLDDIGEALNDVVRDARQVAAIARRAGGEVSRVVAGQLDAYLIPTLDRFADDERQPGSVASLQRFLSSHRGEEEEG